MSKKFDHWCDKKYQKKETNFDTGTLAHKLVTTLTEWVMHDITVSDELDANEKFIQRQRMSRVLETAERIECLIKDANSIFAIYDSDYEERRRRWIAARGYCIRLSVILTHMGEYFAPRTNIQKYVDCEVTVKTLAGKIKNMMISDDKRRKIQVKEY